MWLEEERVMVKRRDRERKREWPWEGKKRSGEVNEELKKEKARLLKDFPGPDA